MIIGTSCEYNCLRLTKNKVGHYTQITKWNKLFIIELENGRIILCLFIR